MKDSIHVVFIHHEFARPNSYWLDKFAFHNEDKTSYFFPCSTYQPAMVGGFVEFEAYTKKASGEKAKILLPSHVIVGIRLEESQQNPFGFLG